MSLNPELLPLNKLKSKLNLKLQPKCPKFWKICHLFQLCSYRVLFPHKTSYVKTNTGNWKTVHFSVHSLPFYVKLLRAACMEFHNLNMIIAMRDRSWTKCTYFMWTSKFNLYWQNAILVLLEGSDLPQDMLINMKRKRRKNINGLMECEIQLLCYSWTEL